MRNDLEISQLNSLEEAVDGKGLGSRFLDVKPLSESDLIWSGNGIDVARRIADPGENSSGHRYAKKCFSQIISSPGRSVLFGPNLVDHLLKTQSTYWQVKPDSIKFAADGNEWKLEELYEFNSSFKNHNVLKKLEGLRVLLDLFRKDQSFLPDLIRRGLADIVKVPTVIEIPQNSDIDVIFVSPNNKPIIQTPNIPFQLRFRQVKM